LRRAISHSHLHQKLNAGSDFRLQATFPELKAVFERFKNRAVAEAVRFSTEGRWMGIFNRDNETVGSGIDKPEAEGLRQKVAAGLHTLAREIGFGTARVTDQGQPIAIDRDLVRQARRVIGKLTSKDQSLVTAESCTAGFIAAVLSQAEGAGDVLHGGFVTYTKENKTAALGVSGRLLKQETSVHARVVEAMAEGALTRSAATVALAVSGVLGPAPDEDGNPVGLVYFCCRSRSRRSICLRKDFGQDAHASLMRLAVVTGLTMLDEFLDEA
jgi:nicotinamide-nucleotide amidase